MPLFRFLIFEADKANGEAYSTWSWSTRTLLGKETNTELAGMTDLKLKVAKLYCVECLLYLCCDLRVPLCTFLVKIQPEGILTSLFDTETDVYDDKVTLAASFNYICA